MKSLFRLLATLFMFGLQSAMAISLPSGLASEPGPTSDLPSCRAYLSCFSGGKLPDVKVSRLDSIGERITHVSVFTFGTEISQHTFYDENGNLVNSDFEIREQGPDVTLQLGKLRIDNKSATIVVEGDGSERLYTVTGLRGFPSDRVLTISLTDKLSQGDLTRAVHPYITHIGRAEWKAGDGKSQELVEFLLLSEKAIRPRIR